MIRVSVLSLATVLLLSSSAGVASVTGEDYMRKSVGFEPQKSGFADYFKEFKYRGSGDVDGSVLLQSETPPVLPGGVNNFFRKNFCYTPEAWKAERKRAITVDCVIRKDGTVTGIECQKISDPALVNEVERVVNKMRWKPATVDGKPVNVYKSFYVDLNAGKIGGCSVPYGLEEIVSNGYRSASQLRKERVACDSQLFKGNLANLKESAELFPEYTDLSLTCARLLSAVGNGKDAVTLIDSCLALYNPFRYANNQPSIRPPRRDYSGKTEIEAALCGLILRSYHDFNSQETFSDVCDLIERRIIDGDLFQDKTDLSASKQRIERLERDMVMEFSRGKAGVGISTPVWEKITREYNVDELSRGLAYWSERGMIDNAAVTQLSALIDQEYDLMRKGKGITDKDRLNLFGTKALAIWLAEGEESMRSYIARTQSGEASKQLKSYLAKLEKNYDRNAAALADRKGVIESLACLVPPQGTDEQGQRVFYERRRAAEKVFPIKWLSGN
ncbi:MAG: hypothetical protein HDS68_04895 [Bacteroidales bacterium]|nr:hypothetical protein [Bacteroidales bacterium]